jgi:hypothetical protein
VNPAVLCCAVLCYAVLSGVNSVGSMLPQLTVKLNETLKLDPERPEYHRATVGERGIG